MEGEKLVLRFHLPGKRHQCVMLSVRAPDLILENGYRVSFTLVPDLPKPGYPSFQGWKLNQGTITNKKKEVEDEVSIYPIANFFSALRIVCRRVFSAFGVNVLACIKEIP